MAYTAAERLVNVMNNGLTVWLVLDRPFQILATFRILRNFFVREQLLATFRKTSTFGNFWAIFNQNAE